MFCLGEGESYKKKLQIHTKKSYSKFKFKCKMFARDMYKTVEQNSLVVLQANSSHSGVIKAVVFFPVPLQLYSNVTKMYSRQFM